VSVDVDLRLRAALLTGDDAALSAWASTGRPGLREAELVAAAIAAIVGRAAEAPTTR
jgi:hypothetical protein